MLILNQIKDRQKKNLNVYIQFDNKLCVNLIANLNHITANCSDKL